MGRESCLMSSKTYLQETQSHVSHLEVWIGRLYDGDNVIEDIIQAFQGLRRIASFVKVEPVQRLSRALGDFFVAIKDGNNKFNFFRFQLVKICLTSLKDCLQLWETSGFCQIPNLNELIQTLNIATIQDNFEIRRGETSLMEVEKVDETSSVREYIQVPVKQLEDLFRSFDNILNEHLQVESSFISLERQVAEGSLDPKLYWPMIREGFTLLKDNTHSLQEQVIALQHQPLQHVLDEIFLWAAVEINKLGKEIQLEIHPSDIRMNEEILRGLPKILIPVLARAIHYGIEEPQIRLARGKGAEGHISLNVRQQASRVIITIQDDGCGIDLDGIRSRILELGLATTQQIRVMSDQELYRFLFMPAFSQGWLWKEDIGLSVVLKGIDQLRGTLYINNKKNQGSSVEIVLPTSLLFQDGICLQVGSRRIIVLAHYVEEILVIDEGQIVHSNAQRYFSFHEHIIPVYNLAMLLDRATPEKKGSSGRRIMIVVYLGKRWGLEIDDLLYHKTILSKPLPPLLKKVDILQGLIQDDNQRLVPIIHIPSVLSRFQRLEEYTIRSFEVNNIRKQYRILVVEDSITTSKIEHMILMGEGYQVDIAGDGIEAMEMLKSKHYDLVLTDIHMPRMDGFVLIKNIRRMENYQDVPVVVVSSSNEDDVENQVASIGGQAFIYKPHFQREGLVSLLGDLLHG